MPLLDSTLAVLAVLCGTVALSEWLVHGELTLGVARLCGLAPELAAVASRGTASGTWLGLVVGGVVLGGTTGG